MLNSKQKKCLELMVSEGLSQKDIAVIIDVAPETISRWKNDAEFVDACTNAVSKEINRCAIRALAKLERLLDAKSDLVKYCAAKAILDYGGFKAEKKISLNGGIEIRDLCVTIDYGEKEEK